MHNFSELLNFDKVEEGQKNLDKAIEIRDMMGGNLYWSIANDDCVEIQSKLSNLRFKIDIINKSLKGMSIKNIESFLRIKKLECLDESLISKENDNPIYSVLESIELKYIEEFLNEYKNENK